MSTENTCSNDHPEKRVNKLRERKQPTLGELNPLLFPPDLLDPIAVEALTLVTRDIIDKHGGRQPDFLQAVQIYNPSLGKHAPRLVARFELDQLSEERVELLETVVGKTYRTAISTRKEPTGKAIRPSFYPSIDQVDTRSGQRKKQPSNLLGWYMGTGSVDYLRNTHCGLFVYKNVGRIGMARYLQEESPKDWFYRGDLVTPMGKPLKTSFLIEIREGEIYQTDVVGFIIQVASILGEKGQPIDEKELLYETYNSLYRFGLKKAGKDTIYGLDEVIDSIERVLVLPLANLELSSGIDLHAGSVLLIGVPGTGKTLVAEYFLQMDNGIFFLPVDALQLAQELVSPPEKKRILPRISRVFNQTGIPIVLHIDDIENIAQGDQITNSTLLNLMAGVRESGFFVLASTNSPEKLSPQLLQPQRFEYIVCMGLPNPDARRGILNVHATRVSKELGIPLFPTEEERNLILSALANETEGFTQRFLAAICNTAKSFYLMRVAEQKKRKIGLGEEDITNYRFTLQDWELAFQDVRKRYDERGTLQRVRELVNFTKNHLPQIGFYLANGAKQPEKLKEAIEAIKMSQQKPEGP